MNDLDIKKIREKLGISQEQLAEMVGVHPRTVQNWESGSTIPNSAINLENQGFTKLVHENVHETPDFTPISGVFLFRFFLFLPQLKH